jgi:hypothetical protein
MPAAETKRVKPLPSKGIFPNKVPAQPTPAAAAAAPPPPPVAPAAGDDRNARTDDDYYHYYLNSQKRVSKWINQTKQEMRLDAMSEVSGVNDEYPASNLDFGTVTSPSVAGETSSTISRTTVPTSVSYNGGRGEGGSKSKEASPTKLKERESRRKLKEKMQLNGTTDEEMYETATADAKSHASADSVTTANTALPTSKELKSRKSMKLPFKFELDDEASTVVRYPDMRPRTVLSGHEPTFTEVMHRLGTKNAAFGSEPSLATGITSTTRLTGRSSERDRLKSSKSKRSSSEPPEFELSWQLMQPVLLILSLATLIVVLVPAAAAAVVVVALGAIAYCLDLLPEMVRVLLILGCWSPLTPVPS